MAKTLKINIAKVIGKGYKAVWNSRKRYVVIKGSRGSKKSTTIALWIIYNMMKYPLANTIVIRRYFNTHAKSTFQQLLWAINKLGVSHLWKPTKNPLMLEYLITGQKIYFVGLDDSMSTTSVTVEHGHLCWAWFEEAYQVNSEDDFNKIDMSIRGQLPKGYFKRIFLTFNPWSEHHWLKARFFDIEDDDIDAFTTNYMCNEFLGEDDIKIFEKMKINNPRRYKIEGLGEWGIAEGLIFDFLEVEFDIEEIKNHPKAVLYCGLDFGYTVDPSAFVASIEIKRDDKKELYIIDEIYERGMSNKEIARRINNMGYGKEVIYADCANPKDIDDLKTMKDGLRRIKPSIKGKDSIVFGINKLKEYDAIYIHHRCENIIAEMSSYAWKIDKTGKKLGVPEGNAGDHAIDALRYSLGKVRKGGLQVWK